MSFIKPLNSDQLKDFDFLMKATKQSMGFTPNSLKVMARIPSILASFSSLAALLVGNPQKLKPLVAMRLTMKNLVWAPKFLKRKDRVPLYLRNLVAYACSNAAGCRYCQAHTISEALHNGVPGKKIKSLWEYKTSPHFDEKERAAISFGLAAGSVPNAVTSVHFDELRKHFSEEHIVELGATIAVFGFLNRWNDTFATELEDKPSAVAIKYLVPQGWDAGKHK